LCYTLILLNAKTENIVLYTDSLECQDRKYCAIHWFSWMPRRQRRQL